MALAGLNEEAESLVHDVLDEKLGRLAAADVHGTLLRLLRALWEGRPVTHGDAPVSNLPPQFQWMKTRDRAVATLRGVGEFSDMEIITICGVEEGAESTSMPMEKIAAALVSIPVSGEMIKRFAVTVQQASPPFRLFSPLGISLLFAGLVLCAVAAWIWHDWQSKADEVLAQKFIDVVKDLSPQEMQPVNEPVGELTDVLFLKYGLENYPLPADFARSTASILGVNHVDGHPVVQIGLKDSHAVLMLFRAEDFGLEPNEDDWQMASLDGWALAMRSKNQQGHVITLHGTPKELSALLPK